MQHTLSVSLCVSFQGHFTMYFIMWPRFQPMREYFIHITFSLIGWNLGHVIWDDIENGTSFVWMTVNSFHPKSCAKFVCDHCLKKISVQCWFHAGRTAFLSARCWVKIGPTGLHINNRLIIFRMERVLSMPMYHRAIVYLGLNISCKIWTVL